MYSDRVFTALNAPDTVMVISIAMIVVDEYVKTARPHSQYTTAKDNDQLRHLMTSAARAISVLTYTKHHHLIWVAQNKCSVKVIHGG